MPKRKRALNKKKLTGKQEAFARHYARFGIGTEAYKKAYPTSKSWTNGSIEVEASKLKKNPKVLLRIEEWRERLDKKFEASIARTIKELSYIAYNDPKNLLDSEGNCLPMYEIPERDRRAIAGLQHIKHQAKGGDRIAKTHYKTFDKVKAADIIIKEAGGYPRDTINLLLNGEEITTVLKSLPDDIARAVKAKLEAKAKKR